MGSGLSTIVMLVLVVISYIVSAIVQAKAKRQEEEEARQAAQERRAQAQAQANARTGAPDQPGSSPQTRQDELAARRRAQLEELRKRRDTQRQPGRPQTESGAAKQTRVSTTSPQYSTQQRGTQLPQTATVRTGRFESPTELHEAPVESERIAPTSRSETRSPGRIKQQQPPAHRKQSSAGRRSGETAEHPGVPTDSPVIAGEIGAETEATDSEIPATPTTIGGDQSLIAGFRRGEFDMQRLREAIVLKEILDPPVALRTESGGT